MSVPLPPLPPPIPAARPPPGGFNFTTRDRDIAAAGPETAADSGTALVAALCGDFAARNRDIAAAANRTTANPGSVNAADRRDVSAGNGDIAAVAIWTVDVGCAAANPCTVVAASGSDRTTGNCDVAGTGMLSAANPGTAIAAGSFQLTVVILIVDSQRAAVAFIQTGCV